MPIRKQRPDEQLAVPPSPGSEYSPPGLGLLANFSSVPPVTPKPPLPPPPSVSPPRPAPPSQPAAVTALTLAEVVRAFSDPAVGTVTVAASLALGGAPLALQGAGRRLVVRSDPSACPQPPPADPAPAAAPRPTGRCTLDAGGLSRHFLVSGGAALRLENLRLRGGWAVQGGSVLAVGAGSLVEADATEISDSSSVGDGGAVLALADAAVFLSGCTFRNCSSFGGAGGAVATIFGGTASVVGGGFSACSAQVGGAAAALFSSRLSLHGASVAGTRAAYAGGIAAINSSTVSIDGSTLSGITCALCRLFEAERPLCGGEEPL